MLLCGFRNKLADQLQQGILPIAAPGQEFIEGHGFLAAAIDDIIRLADDVDLTALGVAGEMEHVLIAIGLVVLVELPLHHRHLILPYDRCADMTVG
ncbi:hypothetical protein RTCIAT899_CH15240 [Rhizobium tropici CIAT 899]|nr:hypothetical protein RTCIAT899_CH15240 [Rhizobium tropici CIAT 899]